MVVLWVFYNKGVVTLWPVIYLHDMQFLITRVDFKQPEMLDIFHGSGSANFLTKARQIESDHSSYLMQKGNLIYQVVG